MKIILRFYIAAVTCLALALPATKKYYGEGIWARSHGIMEFSNSSFEHIDVITTVVALLAWIAPAVFLLWQWDAISSWIKRHAKACGISAGLLATAIIGIAIIGTLQQRREEITPGTPELIIPASTIPSGHTLIPTYPATANQVRRATKANP